MTRVALKNYKSVAACDVHLGPLTVLVGPNGSGKSNFVDSLRFVGDALTTTLDHALRDRGGVNEVRRRSGGHPTQFGVRVELLLPTGDRATYAFEIAARQKGAFAVKQERLLVTSSGGSLGFERSEDDVTWIGDMSASPAIVGDRLLLVSVSGLPQLRPAYDALTGVGTYSLNPDVIRAPQQADAGEILARDGGNLASVVARLDPGSKRRVEQYLSVIVPGVESVDRKAIGPMETLEYRQEVGGQSNSWRFPALNMSDGTLRATGILVALFQSAPGLVAIEEPEIALHPAAAEALYDALSEASTTRQVLITSHSPELLDNEGVTDDQLRAVESRAGETFVGSVSEGDRHALTERLYTAGELLRIGQISPSPESEVSSQLDLFAHP